MNENTNNTNTIRAYFNQFSSKGIPFMDDRDKGDIKTLVGDVLHIDDFGFINGRDVAPHWGAWIEIPRWGIWCAHGSSRTPLGCVD